MIWTIIMKLGQLIFLWFLVALSFALQKRIFPQYCWYLESDLIWDMMQKPFMILIFLSCMVISSVAYAGWTKVTTDTSGVSIYIDFDRISKTGIKTYFWKLVDFPKTKKQRGRLCFQTQKIWKQSVGVFGRDIWSQMSTPLQWWTGHLPKRSKVKKTWIILILIPLRKLI